MSDEDDAAKAALILEAQNRCGSLTAPLGESGVGVDVSYDEDFEAIQAEIAKLSSVDQVPVEWRKVQELALRLLAERGKDFRLATFLAVAATRLGRVRDMLDAYVTLQVLTRDYWDTMFPPIARPRGRAVAIAWMVEISEAHFSELQPVEKDLVPVQALLSVVRELEATWESKLGEAFPGMRGIRVGVEGLLQRVPVKQAVATAATIVPNSAGSTLDVGAIDSPERARHALSLVIPVLKKAAGALVIANPADPFAYALVRAAAYMTVEALPPVDGDRITSGAPPPGAHEALAGARAAGKFQDLLMIADTLAERFPLWLGAQSAALEAIEHLGDSYAEVGRVVEAAAVYMMIRFPELPTLTFGDGTPLVDAALKRRLEGWAGESAGDGESTHAPEGLEAKVREATAFAAQGQLESAVALLEATSAAAGSPRERFRARLASAKLCLGTGRPEIAVAQLEGLEDLIDKHGLMEWDGALCAELYDTLLRAYMGTRGGPDSASKQNKAFLRLCKLDPVTALKLTAR